MELLSELHQSGFLSWLWIGVGAVGITIDVFLISTAYLFMVGLAAVLTGITHLLFPDLPVVWQLLEFITISAIILAILITRRAKLKSSELEKMAGLTGTVARWHGNKGRIRLQRPVAGSDQWDAVCETELSVGDFVIIENTSPNIPNTLIVRK